MAKIRMPNAPISLTNSPSYHLRCTHCGAVYAPDPFLLQCKGDHEPALLRTKYEQKILDVKPQLPGIFRYIDWLPVERCLENMGKPVTYESKGLAHYLGLDRLYISFNGYWPEQNAQLLTGSFKELEAATVLARIPSGHGLTLVLASAGNTGRAFASLCSALDVGLLLVIPQKNLEAIWSQQPFKSGVRLIVVEPPGDYSDAIVLGNHMSTMEGFFPEGGVANVARRDGMGLTVIDATVTVGRIPDHYFQAVGSGSGGIAAWEANLRLLQDGRFGSHYMKLHLAQNHPFTPMVDAWERRSRLLVPTVEACDKPKIAQVSASVLTNRKPAYSLVGGLYDALTDTNGHMYAITNEEALHARHLFKTLEGVDICPASGVATAALIQAVNQNTIRPQDHILLNITSGGTERLRQDYPLYFLSPDRIVTPESCLLTPSPALFLAT
jgi:cysteate synthase